MFHICQPCSTYINHVPHMSTMLYICQPCSTYVNHVPHISTMFHICSNNKQGDEIRITIGRYNIHLLLLYLLNFNSLLYSSIEASISRLLAANLYCGYHITNVSIVPQCSVIYSCSGCTTFSCILFLSLFIISVDVRSLLLLHFIFIYDTCLFFSMCDYNKLKCITSPSITYIQVYIRLI